MKNKHQKRIDKNSNIIKKHLNYFSLIKLNKVLDKFINEIVTGDIKTYLKWYKYFKSKGYYSKQNLGKNKNGEMELNTIESVVLKYGWFIGNFLDVVEKKMWFCINSFNMMWKPRIKTESFEFLEWLENSDVRYINDKILDEID